MTKDINDQYLQTAKQIIPGGVNSPVRAFGSVGGTPIFMDNASGAYLYDTEGNQYIDYVGSWGPCILGHKSQVITEAICKATQKGTSFGTATVGEIKMAQKVIDIMDNIDMVRLVSSGTEATMTALRLARGVTKRDKLIKFSGCYHGHADSFLVKAGSGALTLGIPNSPGVTAGTASDTLTATFNDITSVSDLINDNPNQIAALIVEPIIGNAGLIPPNEHFLKQLRDITTKNGIILIFDEVMTGFRVAAGGAQSLYHVKPDLTTMGKVIGGGMPIGAIGGNKKIMNQLAPAGPIYQAGTLSGNPLAVSAGLAQLNSLTDDIYATLETRSAQLEGGIKDNLASLNLSYQYQRIGSMGSLFFTDKPVENLDDAMTCDTKLFGKYFHQMLKQGIYLPPSQFEANFISAAHSEEDIKKTIAANKKALQEIHP
jgi:glutamate-1-semialdehyde 2,1-aminomutase